VATKTVKRGSKTKAESAVESTEAPLPLGQIDLKAQVVEQGPRITMTIDRSKTIKDATGKVDQCGLVKTVKDLEKGLIDDVKRIMIDAGAGKAEGGKYVAVLHPPTLPGKAKIIDPGKFIRMCAKRGVGSAKVHAAMAVVAKEITFLTADDIEACTVEVPTSGSPGRLNVDLMDNVPMEMQDAIKLLAEKAAAGEIAMPAVTAKSGGRTNCK
jgi:hypothetical protein